jgi:hypothetical protein
VDAFMENINWTNVANLHGRCIIRR